MEDSISGIMTMSTLHLTGETVEKIVYDECAPPSGEVARSDGRGKRLVTRARGAKRGRRGKARGAHELRTALA